MPRYLVPINYTATEVGDATLIVEAASAEEAAKKALAHNYEDLTWGKSSTEIEDIDLSEDDEIKELEG